MQPSRLDLLDLYRGLCVLAVIFFHYTARLPGEYLGYSSDPYPFAWGYLGVQFFFVISGFCIYLTIESSGDALHFLAKRFSRLYPAFLASLLLTYFIKTCAGLPGRESDFLDLLGNVFLLNDFGIKWVDGAYWSLLVEVKYYVIFAVLYRLFGSRLIYRLAALCVAAFFLKWSAEFFLLSKIVVGLEKLLVVSHLPWFLIGAGFYQAYRSGATVHSTVFVGCLILFCDLVLHWSHGAIEKLAALFFVFALMSLVCAKPDLKISPWLKFLGVVSFPLYLLHQYVGFVIIRYLNLYLQWDYLVIFLATFLVVLLAYVVHLTVEFRWRKEFESFFLSSLLRLRLVKSL